ncbi:MULTISPECIES: chemotaxis protein CheW [unclassified Pseudomonas]|uniref:chemotaxis protein CheW n=1 Tax=unclassified Pseudomonas TaxID=196821 RepID=UPI002AC99027|nr:MULTISPECIES: chemotaxis protein CheW [unclassified Pseudomonas]MEB0039566.1 chemotaxis protein CheW [Pseudomonas sp. MH10]MEB0077029.1 chemotaxis protein CheW [Pseudomonas sp. MH10out]MEB0089831.1 chemotaxis protein CheW [Pseudomonas sp. CCI4.2]MEB0102749.1 chemotaxis protein CheW [Pseudomonas sp. CCI3.2]MEB0120215.1 chemotaxis protein CheW [Pseudomonas sp. CCI1.2]
MIEYSAKRGVAPPQNILFLLFHVGRERYALEAVDIAEVLPRLQLKPIAQTPHWVAGVFAHRGAMVPVIDLSALTFGHPAKARTSTRLVLVNYRPDADRPSQLLGLILEQATETLRCAPSEFKHYGLDNQQAAYLGPVREDEQGLLQWVRVQDLLSDPVRELLYPAQPTAAELFEGAP